MAKATDTERSERELQTDINAAVAGTEDEIFRDAMGDDELDKDGDTSLEEMGDGLEGDDLEEGEDAEEVKAKPEGEEEASDEDELEDGTDTDVDLEEQPQGQVQELPDGRGRVPSSLLREANERARTAEQKASEYETRQSVIEARLNDALTRLNTQPVPVTPKAEPRAKPDVFADPDGHEAWIIAEAERKADAKIEQRFAAFQEQQQAQANERVNLSLQQAATGDRAFEFHTAYQKLTSLDARRPENQALARRIFTAADPAAELFGWWDTNGGPEYREQLVNRLLPQDERQEPDNSRQPIHETRLPNRPVRRVPPSLNAVNGTQRQQITDPEMMDGSEESIARYAFAK